MLGFGGHNACLEATWARGGGGKVAWELLPADEFNPNTGARVAKGPVSWDTKAVASSEAISTLTGLMEEAFKLEETIRSGDDLDDAVIEAKGALKKLMTGDEVTELLEGLEMGGEPVWGLSTKERHLVREAKEKIHAV